MEVAELEPVPAPPHPSEELDGDTFTKEMLQEVKWATTTKTEESVAMIQKRMMPVDALLAQWGEMDDRHYNAPKLKRGTVIPRSAVDRIWNLLLIEETSHPHGRNGA